MGVFSNFLIEYFSGQQLSFQESDFSATEGEGTAAVIVEKRDPNNSLLTLTLRPAIEEHLASGAMGC